MVGLVLMGYCLIGVPISGGFIERFVDVSNGLVVA